MVGVVWYRFERLCGGSTLHIALSFDPAHAGQGNPAFPLIRVGGTTGGMSPIYYGGTNTYAYSGPSGVSGAVLLQVWDPAYRVITLFAFTFPEGFRPHLSLEGLRYVETPCAGTTQTIRASVRETGGMCEGEFHLEWLGMRTDVKPIPPGASVEIPLEFKVPRSPAGIEVSLVDDLRETTVGSLIASITPKIPDLRVSDFVIPKLVEPEVCHGATLDGSVSILVLGCAQKLRGKISDAVSGEVLASFEPRDYMPEEEIRLPFSFTMPARDVALIFVAERMVDQNWQVVKEISKGIGFRVPELTIGCMEVPERACSGVEVEPSLDVTGGKCPQRIRSRLIDEETAKEVHPYVTVDLGSNQSAVFKFPFTMAWRGMKLRAEVERFDPVNRVWSLIGEARGAMGQKVPATGVITATEVAEVARPGLPTSGSVTVENQGECVGDILVEGFVGEGKVIREIHTFEPSEIGTTIYSAMMPPAVKVPVAFRVGSMREGDFVQTSSAARAIAASRAVVLEDRMLSIHGGDEPYSYSGVIIARNVEWQGPRPIEEEAPITPLRPLKGTVRPYVFAGRVEPGGQSWVSFDPGSLVYLKMVTGVGNSWCVHGTLRGKDTKVMTYSAVGSPLVVALSKLAMLPIGELEKIAGLAT